MKLFEVTAYELQGQIFLVWANSAQEAEAKVVANHDLENPEDCAVSEVVFEDGMACVGPGER